MDRIQLLLVGFPVFLFCSDLVSLFSPPSTSTPSKPPLPRYHHPQTQSVPQVPDFATVQVNIALRSQIPSLLHLNYCLLFSNSRRQPSCFLFFSQGSQVRGSGYGTVVELKFCVSCSYRSLSISLLSSLNNFFPFEVILRLSWQTTSGPLVEEFTMDHWVIDLLCRRVEA